MRRITVALLTAVVAAVAPAAARAETSSDVAARAFADAALQAAPEIAEASKRLATLGKHPPCKVRRVLRRHRASVAELTTKFHVAHTIASFTRTVGPTMLRASQALHAVQTSDPALRSGRTAWRRLRRDYASFAALPAASSCAQVRAFARNGFRHTRSTRRTIRTFHATMAWDTSDIDHRMSRAVVRLIELGVSAADADAFDGELGE